MNLKLVTFICVGVIIDACSAMLETESTFFPHYPNHINFLPERSDPIDLLLPRRPTPVPHHHNWPNYPGSPQCIPVPCPQEKPPGDKWYYPQEQTSIIDHNSGSSMSSYKDSFQVEYPRSGAVHPQPSPWFSTSGFNSEKKIDEGHLFKKQYQHPRGIHHVSPPRGTLGGGYIYGTKSSDDFLGGQILLGSNGHGSSSFNSQESNSAFNEFEFQSPGTLYSAPQTQNNFLSRRLDSEPSKK